MDLQGYATSEAANEFRVTLTLSVGDADALWTAAAMRTLMTPGTTLEDVADTIGPREDPSIADCIAMLAIPAAVTGCELRDVEVEAIDTAPLAAVLAMPSPAWQPAARAG